MKRKLVSLFLVLVFIFSTTGFVMANNNDNLIAYPRVRGIRSLDGWCSQTADANAYVLLPGGEILTMVEFLEELNSGNILPNESVIAYEFHICCEDMTDNAARTSWPWTSCTNIGGHNWTNWSAWTNTGNIRHSNNCGASWNCTMEITRGRQCLREHCTLTQRETDTVRIMCNM
ncbi:MAG: hypothetical protein FWC91_12310 [Defluviitaleaceae bacterium]|nr:hypothetical protein [Defluviitaleaceae bacterium]